jgi:adenine-specific DNA-methyltransferase
VEVTRFSLSLKALEDTRHDELLEEWSLFKMTVLPDLRDNIKCGNSLIGNDYFANQLIPDMAELTRVNPFDWKREFSEIMANGGFDVVIGNPPYGAALSDEQRAYFQLIFRDESKALDSYELFLLKSGRLLNQNGQISMIIPSSWFTGEKYSSSRRKLVTEFYPVVAYALPFDVFKDAYIDTAIIVLSATPTENCLIHFFPKREKLAYVPGDVGSQVPIKFIRQDDHNRLSVVLSKESASILQKINSSHTQLGDWFKISRGVQPYSRSKHTEEQIKKRFLHACSQESRDYLPELQGNELSRYFIAPDRTSYLKYSEEIASIRPMKMFEGKRIALRRLLTRKFRLQASLAIETMITTDNVLNMVPRSKEVSVEFALGILNSRLSSWVYVNTSTIAQKDDFPQVYIAALAAIRLPNYDERQHDTLVQLVTAMLELHKRHAAATTQTDQELYQRQIAATDRQIDALVYELYALTPEEIAIVESDGK